MILLIQLIRNECRSLFFAASTYIAAVLSVLLMGFLYVLTLVTISAEPQSQTPPTIYFSMFWIPALLIVPMLTMRSLAEERRMGTLETLMTAPVHPAHIVTAKFFAAYFFYAVVWGIGFLYPVLATLVLGIPFDESPLLDTASSIGSFSFVALSGVLFISIGIFASSLTRSQLVAGMLTFSAIFMLVVGAGAMRLLQVELGIVQSLSQSVLSYFQILKHFEDFSNGIIDTRPIIYYLSSSVMVLSLSVVAIESKRG